MQAPLQRTDRDTVQLLGISDRYLPSGCVVAAPVQIEPSADLEELFLERGWAFTYEAVREWERQFTPLIAEQLRTRRRGQAGQSWYVDETYVKVKGKWCYLYRAIDTDGNLVDSRLSEKRDM